MLSLDRDYLALKPYLEAETRRRKIEFKFEELNPAGWGDVMFLSPFTGIHNVEIKGASELIGGLDHMINQIKAQSEHADHLWLFVYGEMRPAEDGNSYSLQLDKAWESWTSRAGIDTGWVESYSRRFHRVNWDGQRKILWRLREVGVQVVECRNLEELASELCLLYEASQSEGSTFTRLIKEKIRVSEGDPAKALFMRQLMGLEAGIGEEVANAIADWLGKSPKIMDLIYRNGDDSAQEFLWEGLAKTPLRSGKRTVGPAAVKRLREALGL